jgi:transcriptional regulator with XRE-family HTH domain
MRTIKLTPELENARVAIAEKVRELRRGRHWSQAELAERLGLSQSRLSDIEQGAGSFTAEQFLLLLKLFNISVGDFTLGRRRKQNAEIQNALVRLGAGHLQESTDVLPSEQFEEVGNMVREVLIAAESPRHITALAPVVVHNIDRINLAKLDAQFLEAKLERRLGWLIANTLEAVRRERDQVQTRPWASLYRRAEVVLSGWLEFLTPAEIAQRSSVETKPLDILDRDIRSQKSLEETRTSSSNISRRWGIVSSLQPADFSEALRAARAGV